MSAAAALGATLDAPAAALGDALASALGAALASALSDTLASALATTLSDWDFGWWWAFVAGAYVLGMFPTAQIVGYVTEHDPTEEGSRNPGATNVYRIAGMLPGLLVLLGDVAKVVLPTLLGLLLVSREVAVVAGATAVIGHMFPAARSFRGGKGVASYGGFVVVLSPLAALFSLALWAVIVKLSGRVSVASLVASPTVLGGMAVYGRQWWEMLAVAALVVLIVVKHSENIGRLMRREEARL